MYISKSKYMAGLQCHKLLWYYYNQKDAISSPDASQQAIFDQGHEVGELAKRLYPRAVTKNALNARIRVLCCLLDQFRGTFAIMCITRKHINIADHLSFHINNNRCLVSIKSLTGALATVAHLGIMNRNDAVFRDAIDDLILSGPFSLFTPTKVS